ncbi:aldo-keto reductase [Heterostelium album PN500]|uniref:Aldo-keto reductase n=1 Tax=Heterostelium pallidum (strain ATCC 26659 / Pp 5 / PN500) TaxID=670386 RepID=D3BPZ9_HETP5|nr:aldo-keto reductase [Heterostelium album PN500]EFA76550.1 aldo-keto reductase [Heterostelium album PN500]|eukprot:XP_020428682.1 aldo-keto reductase [Heterostelium album PN500]
MEYRTLGKTGLKVSLLSYGGSPLGGIYGHNDEKKAIESVHYAIKNGINFIDTSPYYGKTLSESVLGRALAGIPRDKFIMGTKVGRYDTNDFNFSYDRIIESVKESLDRLNLEYLDIVQCHDIEFGDLHQVINESIPALLKLKSDGLVRHIGVTGYPLKALKTVAESHPSLDVVLSYCHFCLNDSSLDDIIPTLKSQNIGIINASFLNMGMLTERGPPEWHPAPTQLRELAAKASQLCKSRGSDISKLALQYTFSHPDIATNLVGMPCIENIDDNLKTMREPIDKQLLSEVLDIFKPMKNYQWKSGKPENN